jgi:acyl-CoA thioesterase I
MAFRLARGILAALLFAVSGVLVVSGVAVASSHPVVVAIGDSIMEGHGLRPGQSWAGLLAKQHGWRFTNLASDGSGFLKVGTKGDTFADQVRAAVKLNPSVILLAGSSNDLGESNPALAKETTATIASIRAALPDVKIIAVSAIWGATSAPAQLKDIDGQVESAVTAVGGKYVDIGQPLAGHPELMQSDTVHPTAAGQRVLADSIVAAFRAQDGGA